MKTLSNFEQIAKKNKRKNWLKTVLLSTLLTLAVTGGVYYLLEKKTSSNGEKMMENYLTLSEIAYPNIDYISWGYETTSNFSGQFYSNRMKDIDGILVPFEKYSYLCCTWRFFANKRKFWRLKSFVLRADKA